MKQTSLALIVSVLAMCVVGRAETATDPAPLTMIETVIQLKPRSEWRAGMTPEGLRAELDKLENLSAEST